MTQDDMFENMPSGPDYPERLRVMWRAYGRNTKRKCGSCLHYIRFRQRTRWAKCDLTAWTHGPGTDWQARWPACGQWAEK